MEKLEGMLEEPKSTFASSPATSFPNDSNIGDFASKGKKKDKNLSGSSTSGNNAVSVPEPTREVADT